MGKMVENEFVVDKKEFEEFNSEAESTEKAVVTDGKIVGFLKRNKKKFVIGGAIVTGLVSGYALLSKLLKNDSDDSGDDDAFESDLPEDNSEE